MNYFEGLLLVLLQMNLSPLVIPVTLMCTLRRRCLIKTATKSMEVANGWKCNLGDFFAHINHFVLIVPNFIPKPLRLQGCVEKLFSPIAEMQKVADAADISVLFFSAGANFWAILTILGHFRAEWDCHCAGE